MPFLSALVNGYQALTRWDYTPTYAPVRDHCWREGCKNEYRSPTGLCETCIEQMRRWSLGLDA